LEVLDAWAVKIAEEVAPDEVDLAPVMAHAFVSGGKDKEELFRRQGGPVQGAFGPEFATAIFPGILLAIQQFGPELQETFDLASGLTGSGYYVAGAISTIIGIRGRKDREEKKETLIEDSRIKQLHSGITEEVSKIPNLDEDQADLIAYRLLRVMLQEPTEASQFTEKIEKSA
jgi:hypothetical protein